MDVILIALGIVGLVVGLFGCVVPMLPGPPVAYLSLVLLHLTDKVQYSWTELIVWFVLVVIVQVLDFIVPMLGTKYTGGSEGGKRGALVGTLLGLFFMPWGIILGPFLGTVVGELVVGQTGGRALLSGLGSLLGFLLGTLAKLMLCCYFIWEFMASLFSAIL